ncbi:hypothetical protein [uncultured Spirosoma sp.]|uniref:hypothetical protein n=1 Tax=uncultured Spirosoma sp. TaxID=278208 RepID=UPI00258A80A3|nr:hypothetical protein [uncultured Spirosoma sp.]
MISQYLYSKYKSEMMKPIRQIIELIRGKVAIDVIDSWQTDVDDSFECELDALKFIFAQAEKKLEDSNKVFEVTTTKSVSIIALLSSIFIAQSAYFFLSNDLQGKFDPKLFAVFCSAFMSLLILRYLLNNILPVRYHTIGSSPNRLFNTEFFNEKSSGKTVSFLYANEIETYQVKIEYNFKLNTIRLARIRFSIYALLLLPIMVLTLFYTASIILAFFL